MSKFIKLVREASEEITELPLEDDDTLLLSNVGIEFPGALGLKAVVSKTSKRTVKVRDGKLFPLEACSNPETKFIVTIGAKRAREETGDADPVPNSKHAAVLYSLELIVLGLPFDEKDEGLRAYFQKFGKISSVEIKRFPNGNSKGYGFVKFADETVAKKVLGMVHKLGGRDLVVKIPFARPGPGGAGNYAPPAHSSRDSGGEPVIGKLCVGKLTPKVTEIELRQFFSKYGPLKDVYVPRKPFRGIAYLQYVDNGCLEKALQLTRAIVADVEVSVSRATPRVFNPNFPQQQQNNMSGNMFNPQNFQPGNLNNFNNFGNQSGANQWGTQSGSNVGNNQYDSNNRWGNSIQHGNGSNGNTNQYGSYGNNNGRSSYQGGGYGQGGYPDQAGTGYGQQQMSQSPPQPPQPPQPPAGGAAGQWAGYGQSHASNGGAGPSHGNHGNQVNQGAPASWQANNQQAPGGSGEYSGAQQTQYYQGPQ